jgi:hypothetical protein
MNIKLLDLDFRQGKLQTKSFTNIPLTYNNVSISKKDKGYSAFFDGKTSRITHGTSDIIYDTTQPLIITCWLYCNKENPNDINCIYGKRFGAKGVSFYYSSASQSTVFALQNVQNTDSLVVTWLAKRLSLNVWNSIIVTYDGSKKANGCNLYINGQLQSGKLLSQDTLSSSTIANAGTGSIGDLSLEGYVWKGSISKFQVLQGTVPNISQYVINDYIELLNTKTINKSIIFQPNISVIKPSEIREQGLIAAYSFNPINGKIPNIAWDNPANGYNARQYDGNSASTIYGIKTGAVISDGYIFNNRGYFKFPGTMTIIGDLTISAILNITATTNITFGGKYTGSNPQSTDGAFQIANRSFIFRDLSGSFNYGGLPLGKLVLTFTRSSSNWKTFVNGVINISGIKSPANYSSDTLIFNNVNEKTKVYDYRIYNRALSDKEIKNYYNQFVKNPTIFEDFSQYLYGATKINNWYFTGTVSITEETTKNNIIGLGYKLLSVNSGEAYTQSNTAYGTWEWKVKYTALPGGFYNGVQFIGSSKKTETNLGYGITSTVTTTGTIDSISITKAQAFGYGASVIKSVPVNLTTNIWYKFKVTRFTDGFSKLYINDKLITTFTDNTYTTSKYFGFSKPYFNKLYTDIKIIQGIIV